MIEALHISKSYGTVQAVKDVSLHLKAGSITGLLGPNGAGKTTTLRLLAGLDNPDSGSIHIAHTNLIPTAPQYKSKVGYLPESVPLYPHMRVIEILHFVGQCHGLSGSPLQQRLRILVPMCQLQDVLQKKCETLSKGVRQRTGLALALIHDPEILILDEPTEGLDPVQILEIRKLLQTLSQSKTILLSSHILSEITQLCEHILILKNGEIVAQGNLADFGGNTQSLEKKFVELNT